MTDVTDPRDSTTRPRRRRTLIGAAAIAAVAVIVGVSVVVVRSGQDEPRPGITDGANIPGTHIRDRIGPAVELVARTGDTGDTGLLPHKAGTPVAQAEQDFALALLRHLSRRGNVSVSPASLAIALSMLQNGAVGPTREQIQRVLRTTGLTSPAQDAGWADLSASWTAARPAALHTANSVWLQRGFPVHAPFLDALTRFYATGVWQVDFARDNAAAVSALNTWTSGQTHGKITKLFDELPADTRAVLANAAYFKAGWANPFAANNTSAQPFTRTDGTKVSRSFLHAGGLDVPAAVTPGYSAVQLPYRGGRFAALAIMPRSTSLPAFTAGLTTDRLTGIVSSLRSATVDLSLPKFTTRSTLALKQTLSTLGMPLAFSDRADFAAMTPQAVHVGSVLQRVYLSVTETGTEAAAATGITVEPSAGRVGTETVTFDHPFLFLIRDVKTGAIVFATQLNDPAAG